MFHKGVKLQADLILCLFFDFFSSDCHIRQGWEDGRKSEETLVSSGNKNDFSVRVYSRSTGIDVLCVSQSLL